MKNAMKFFVLFALAIGICSAQITLSTTTLSSAITTTSTNQTGQTINVAAITNMAAPGPTNLVNTALWVDNELMTVLSIVDSTHVTVRRGAANGGAGSKPTTHLSGATVWYSYTQNGVYAMSQFTSNSGPENWASCQAIQQIALPRINTYWGSRADCLGVTTAGHWVRTDAPGQPVLGATYTVPAGTIVPNGSIFITDTGTNQATGIQVPYGAGAGFVLTIIPGGAFTTTTSGGLANICLASTAVAKKTLTMTYNGTCWNPSY